MAQAAPRGIAFCWKERGTKDLAGLVAHESPRAYVQGISELANGGRLAFLAVIPQVTDNNVRYLALVLKLRHCKWLIPSEALEVR